MTNSRKKPYVVITIDRSSYLNDHIHHVSKDGRVDMLYVDGMCVPMSMGMS
ncbi:MAG: hypothetical protein OER95_08010 [Acidimicrobiia bacterium]|nr:hypothetical protein [Acidimicrobiia bacterium]